MAKLNYKTIFIPVSKNFSELTIVTQSEEGDEAGEFVVGDDGKAADQVESDMQADAMLLDLLSRFTDRQKIILMYQILRESGYNLNHEDCARTLSLTREHYMTLLKEIKRKAQKIIQP